MHFRETEFTSEAKTIIKRFANVFDFTYTRFYDLKLAEQQLREAQIETALERVRSRTMGMQHTEELQEVIQVIYEQLVHLGFEINNSGILTDFRETDDFNLWMADPYTTFPTRITIPYIDHPQMNCFKEGKAKGLDFLTYSLTLEEKNKWFEYCFPILGVPEEAQQIVFDSSGLATSAALLKNVSLYLINFSGVPYSDADNAILMRFGKVFEQTYTRFKDLEQAEAQAREGQIQLALERVRARTMAMYHSEELAETAHVLFEQLSELGNEPARISIGIMDQEKEEVSFWATDQVGGQIDVNFTAPISEKTTISKMHAGWQAKLKSLSIELRGKELAAWVRFCREEMGIIIRDELLQKRRVHTVGYFSHGWINYTTHAPLSLETTQILERFATMFSYTYTRFLDLQKAEAQVREAQIESSLERVRSKTMAMHNSQDVGDTIATMFSEFVKLGIETIRCGIAIGDSTNEMEIWAAKSNPDGTATLIIGRLDMMIHPLLHGINSSWKNKESTFEYRMTGDDLKDYYRALNRANYYPVQFDIDSLPAKQVCTDFFFADGGVFAFTDDPLADSAIQIFKRFAGVFGQTYRRYLDLQKAEAQAREGQIQLALERVRARTMAMQHSDELAETVYILFQQFKDLGENPDQATIGIINEEEHVIEYWVTMHGNQENRVFKFSLDEPNVTRKIYNAWKQHKKSLVIDLSGKTLHDFMTYRASKGGAPVNKAEKRRVINVALFSKGLINVQSTAERSAESILLLERFAQVFEGTYTRFLDLKKAEEQARESQIELSLERLRAKTMAMHTSEHVGETVATMFDELIKLGIDSTARTGISIIGDNREMELWRASYNPNGEVEMLVGRVDMTIHPSLKEVYKAWKSKQVFYSYELTGEDQENYFRALNDSPDYAAQFDLTALPAQQTNSVFFFPEGCVYVFTVNPLSEDEVRLFKRFAGVFGLTYRRYLDLQKAENQAREAQIQLGLERVRAKAMAMQNSEELNELIGTVFGELTKLDFVLTRCLIMIFDPETKASRWWMANSEAPAEPMNYLVQNHKNPAYDAYLKAWKERNLKWRYSLKGKVKKDWDNFLFVDTELVQLPAPVIAGMKAPEQVLLSASFNNFGCLTLVTLEPLSDEHSDIMLRFAKVFDMSYTRFNDLKQAETQARESQIQLALERVRARTWPCKRVRNLGKSSR